MRCISEKGSISEGLHSCVSYSFEILIRYVNPLGHSSSQGKEEDFGILRLFNSGCESCKDFKDKSFAAIEFAVEASFSSISVDI